MQSMSIPMSMSLQPAPSTFTLQSPHPASYTAQLRPTTLNLPQSGVPFSPVLYPLSLIGSLSLTLSHSLTLPMPMFLHSTPYNLPFAA